MSLTDRLIALARLTLEDPRTAARALLAEDVPLPARSAGLLLVAVVSALLASVQIGLSPQPMDPISAFMLASPFRAAVVQWVFLALSVLLIHRVGRAFGGRGAFADALLVVVWLQVLMLVVQALQLVTGILIPPLAGLIGLGGFALFLWLMTCFIAELHGFASRGKVFLGMVVTAFAAGLVLGVLVMLLVGPEALMPNV
ncbi:YIP1 family protein [Rhodobacter calidifons]|uniref:YIP1 family protein n=1 Tax=Rhodobacter calidifons TaxID=2715277 RepID=A0ABX0G7E1_9RHOB|nr:YIP1 family protein [Rhodobacter calidifons]NHB76882.1 YIP1 family protein [Rhodobacter calidifons]